MVPPAGRPSYPRICGARKGAAPPFPAGKGRCGVSTLVPTRNDVSALAHPATAQVERPPLDRDNPWPALDSFHEADHHFFRGRTEEAIDLLRLVLRAQVAVLYGVSGIGKSSLLEAGLFHLLRQENALPISIRLDFSNEDPKLTSQVKQAISAQAVAAGVEAPSQNDAETLWEYFHRQGQGFWDAHNRLVMPVLVFDQFEELFTLGGEGSRRRARVREFLIQLADLAEGRAPEVLQRWLEGHPEDTSKFAFGRHQYRVLMGVREDFVAEVDDLRTLMPAIAVSRKRLLAMNGEGALEVVNQAPHLISPEVAEQVVRFVAKAESGSNLAEAVVDPALLSVMCSELNEKRRSRGEAMISGHLLEGTRDQILRDFYERAMKDVSLAARRLVEERLILDPGYRDTVALDTLLRDPAVTMEDIDRLISHRLVRIERRGGARRVELTHDLLIGVIRESRDKRHIQEKVEEERTARVAAEERERIARRRRTLRRTQIVAGAFVLLGLLAVGAAAWALWKTKQATVAAKSASVAANLAKEAEASALSQRNRARAAEDLALRKTKEATEAAHVGQTGRGFGASGKERGEGCSAKTPHGAGSLGCPGGRAVAGCRRAERSASILCKGASNRRFL